MPESIATSRNVHLQIGPATVRIALSDEDLGRLAGAATAGDALKLIVSRLDGPQADVLARFLGSEGVVVVVQQGPVSRALTLRTPLRGDEILALEPGT